MHGLLLLPQKLCLLPQKFSRSMKNLLYVGKYTEGLRFVDDESQIYPPPPGHSLPTFWASATALFNQEQCAHWGQLTSAAVASWLW